MSRLDAIASEINSDRHFDPQYARELARRALQSLRDPSDTMVDAISCLYPELPLSNRDAIRRHFDLMIDAVLMERDK